MTSSDVLSALFDCHESACRPISPRDLGRHMGLTDLESDRFVQPKLKSLSEQGLVIRCSHGKYAPMPAQAGGVFQAADRVLILAGTLIGCVGTVDRIEDDRVWVQFHAAIVPCLPDELTRFPLRNGHRKRLPGWG